MAKKKTAPNESHQVSLADHIQDQTTVLLFGKALSDVPPDANGNQFAQIVGTMRNQSCQKLPKPILVALPEPEGPASACGWDPQQYLMWRVPATFVATAMHLESAPLHHLVAAADEGKRMTRSQSLQVCAKSIRAVTQSSRDLDPSDTLQLCGIIAGQQIAQLRATITGDPVNGVAQFGFSLSASAMAFVSSGTTIDQLATTIEGAAT